MKELAEAELCKAAIEAMEACAKSYRVAFGISYKGQNKGYVSAYSDRWKVTVYGHIFSDQNFCKAVGQAVEFVVKVEAPHLLNSTPNPEPSVATDDASSNSANQTK